MVDLLLAKRTKQVRMQIEIVATQLFIFKAFSDYVIINIEILHLNIAVVDQCT